MLVEIEGSDLEIEYTGFDTAEIDVLLGGTSTSGSVTADPDDQVDVPDPLVPTVSRPGDLGLLGKHRLLCANALDEASYHALLAAERATMVFTDMPYNVSITTHASGLGKARHGEFAMASGEMSRPEFIAFLTAALSHMAAFSCDGSIHYQCMA